ncbi:MAG: helicase-related protein [bacterium]|nr:helicase-related protein [bacterium]
MSYSDKPQIADEQWQLALDYCGDVIRRDRKEGQSRQSQVVARSYTLNEVLNRLQVRKTTLEQAMIRGLVVSFVDPDNQVRLPAYEVEQILGEPERMEQIIGLQRLDADDLMMVLGDDPAQLKKRLSKAGLNASRLMWDDVRGRWGLPESFREFRAQVQRVEEEWNKARRAKRQEQRSRVREQRREEREQRRELRRKLMEAFPSWSHEGRIDQRMTLHVGPPNSGKTHDALIALEKAGSGWYLAPLRLLAFEIFDRLNQRGTPCNLLTGEEYIPVPGATITAATVEMFNASQSGDCIIVDEAQMLADPDRGWAWTRALTEAQAPEIHVISPKTAQSLIEQLASAADIPLQVVEHERLAPISIAEEAWPLEKLPPQTILVAFSRQMVLHLKTELEYRKRRVSVIYGNLPPEVRRKQADRFASGETDICIATDAVGMGLNLPADYVCFYEIEKFDGREKRLLTPAEVQQIGGRAGRFGFSKAGVVGATNKRNLRWLRDLFYGDPEVLTHARVAPTHDDLQMIPGTLAEQLNQWAELQSIPEKLRDKVRTADLTEPIELAKMLEKREVEKLGLALALKLINAPTRNSSRSYWRRCADAILDERAMPLPYPAPDRIVNSRQLEETEVAISCADIYLWLSQRKEFTQYAPDHEHLRELRFQWSENIDRALLERLDTARRCPQCGKILPINHRYKLCDRCYSENFFDDYE